MKFTFWGVRGSIPSPGPEVVKYGGNTPCVELWFDDLLIILDAGSGIRPLGISLMDRFEKINGHIFITHMHWDHIQGLPFFGPLRSDKNTFKIFGCEEADLPLNQIVADQMKSVYFPVSLNDLNAKISFQNLYEEFFSIEGIHVRTMYVNHPGNTLGYRFDYKGQSLVYVSDNEPYNGIVRLSEANGMSKSRRPEDFLEDNNMRLVRFAKDADIMIHDSQYFPEEYKERVSWGHSPFTYTTDVALAAGIKNLYLYHHDPGHNDQILEEKLDAAKKIIEKSGKSMNCVLARERETVVLY